MGAVAYVTFTLSQLLQAVVAALAGSNRPPTPPLDRLPGTRWRRRLLSRFVLQRLPRALQQPVQATGLGFLHGGQEEPGKILAPELSDRNFEAVLRDFVLRWVGPPDEIRKRPLHGCPPP